MRVEKSTILISYRPALPVPLVSIAHLFKVGLKQVPEVLDGVVPVLVERSQQLLETLLDPVGVGRVLVEGVGEAGHGHLLALKFGRRRSSALLG